MELVVALAGGAAVLMLAIGLWLPVRSRESVMQRRIDGFVTAGSGRPGALAVDLGGRRRHRVPPPAPAEVRGVAPRWLERRMEKAQVGLAPRAFVGAIAGTSVAASLVAAVAFGPLVGCVAAAATPALALFWLARRAGHVQRRFSIQLADTVSLLASSVRAGHSVQQALEHVSQEAPEPTRSAFALAVREVGLGASLEDALARLVERYPSEYMELVVTAINVHSAIGGSLAKILDGAAGTIRERTRMEAEVNALTAQQRYSAYVLALLPVFTLVGLWLISPDYLGDLLKPGGLRIALFGAAGLVLVGFIVMRRMAIVDE